MKHKPYPYLFVPALFILGVLVLSFQGIRPRAAYGEPVTYDTAGTAGGEKDQEASPDGPVDGTMEEYREYRNRFDSIKTKASIESKGFHIVENQVFPMELMGEGEVSFIPAYHREYSRLALFFAKEDGTIVYKTDQLETNNQCRGTLYQPNERLSAVSFQDMDSDGLTDIVLITACSYGPGEFEGRTYKVGDVLFQKEGGFYRDYRLSDKINRFGMNKSIRFITSFIRDGYSTGFLYTAATLEELLDSGLRIIQEQYSRQRFEKLGRLMVVPGTYRMAEYTVFMIYLINEQGYITWSFQPMGDYENLYGLKGISCRDIDGDGLKDVVVLASYSYEGKEGETVVETDYSVYYQRTSGFYEDTMIKNEIQCSDRDTMWELVERLQEYWGWKSEE